MGPQPLKKIMLVEDEEDIRVLVKMSLEKMGDFDVEVCESGIEAIEKSTVFHPDLILLDVMMPEMDGPGTLERLRRDPRSADIPVIFLTARSQSEAVESCRHLGVIGIITKPFDPVTLPDFIKNIWDGRNKTRHDDIDGDLYELHKMYLDKFPAKSAFLKTLLERLKSEPEDLGSLDELKESLHKLRGSAGSYGFDEVGKTAEEWERYMELIVENKEKKMGELEIETMEKYLESIDRSILDSKKQ